MKKSRLLYVLSQIIMFIGLMLPIQLTAMLILILNPEGMQLTIISYLLGLSIMPTLVIIAAKIYNPILNIIEEQGFTHKYVSPIVFSVLALSIVLFNAFSNNIYNNLFYALIIGVINLFLAYYYTVLLAKLSDYLEKISLP